MQPAVFSVPPGKIDRPAGRVALAIIENQAASSSSSLVTIGVSSLSKERLNKGVGLSIWSRNAALAGAMCLFSILEVLKEVES